MTAGRKYDKSGNLREWWSPSIEQKFMEQALCLIDQYSSYRVVEAGINVCSISCFLICMCLSVLS